MATVTFTPITGYNKARWATNAVELRAAAAFTASWVTTTNDVNVIGYAFVNLYLTWVFGAETLLRIRPQGYNGTAWVDLTYKAPQGSGVSETTKDIIQLTKANFTDGEPFGLPKLDVAGYQKIRCQVQGTSGTTFGTIAISASGGVYVSDR